MTIAAARLFAALALAATSALSVAQPDPATTLPPTVPNPSLVGAPPAGSLPATPAEGSPSPAGVEPTPAPRVADIAIVLPLDSPDYGRAAAAVRDGFIAAAEAAGIAQRCRVIGHRDGGVVAAFDEAKALGVQVVVGPLVRDDLRTIAGSDTTLPLTLALNRFDDAAPLPPTVYALALSIESDAQLLARRMRSNTIASVAIIGGTGPLDQRFRAAFTDAWRAAGGGAPEFYRFDVAPDALGDLRRDLARSNAQAVVVTLPGARAALARTFAPRLPAYVTSLANEAMEPAALADLEGAVFVDVPWLVRPSDPAFVSLPQRDVGNNALRRLYALGLDAFAVARTFTGGVPEQLELQGATGRLTLGEGRVLAREGAFAEFRGGQPVPADAAR